MFLFHSYMKSYEIHDKMKVIFTNNEKCAETCAVHKIKEDVMNVRFAYQVNAEFFKKKERAHIPKVPETTTRFRSNNV